MITDHPHYTVRTLSDGLADDHHIEADYPNIAERLFSSTIETIRRMDLPETTVQLIAPDGELLYDQTITPTD